MARVSVTLVLLLIFLDILFELLFWTPAQPQITVTAIPFINLAFGIMLMVRFLSVGEKYQGNDVNFILMVSLSLLFQFFGNSIPVVLSQESTSWFTVLVSFVFVVAFGVGSSYMYESYMLTSLSPLFWACHAFCLFVQLFSLYEWFVVRVVGLLLMLAVFLMAWMLFLFHSCADECQRITQQGK